MRYFDGRLRGLEVACPLRKPKVPARVDRFSGWENRMHACHMIMWHDKDLLSIILALVFSTIFSIRQELVLKLIQFENLALRAVTRWCHHEMVFTLGDLPCLHKFRSQYAVQSEEDILKKVQIVKKLICTNYKSGPFLSTPAP
ncbi:hypothetical protein TNCV_4833871 [Trichonephila clavipes]|nr:hypothetical protein TNCV_4833871 [Trichonephila clavipes]